MEDEDIWAAPQLLPEYPHPPALKLPSEYPRPPQIFSETATQISSRANLNTAPRILSPASFRTATQIPSSASSKKCHPNILTGQLLNCNPNMVTRQSQNSHANIFIRHKYALKLPPKYPHPPELKLPSNGFDLSAYSVSPPRSKIAACGNKEAFLRKDRFSSLRKSILALGIRTHEDIWVAREDIWAAILRVAGEDFWRMRIFGRQL